MISEWSRASRTGFWPPPRPVEGVSVRDFGAKGDGKTDDTAAIQAAIDSVKPNSSAAGTSFTGSKRVFFPRSTQPYMTSAPLSIYSATWLDGDGPGSRVQASAGFAGAALVQASTAGLSPGGYLQHSQITELAFGGPGDLWAVDLSTVATLVSIHMDGITFYTSKGLNLSSYLQNSIVRRLAGGGPVDRMLWVRGNHNLFELIDKEGSTGSSAEPYILVEGHAGGVSHGNHFKGVLIEQATSANKTLMRFETCSDLVLEDVWCEPTASNGYALHLVGTTFQIRGWITHIARSLTKIRLSSGSVGSIDTIRLDGEDQRVEDAIEVDPGSFLRIERATTRRGYAHPVSEGLRVGESWNQSLLSNPVPGAHPVVRQERAPFHNLLVNPSFEAGRYGWSFTAYGVAPDSVEEYVPSGVGHGLMGHFRWSGPGTRTLTQSVVIHAAMVGQPVTFSALVKGTGSASLAAPYMVGAGVATFGPTVPYNRADLSDGDWHQVSGTVIPQAAGTLNVGVVFSNLTGDAYVDECSLAMGTVANQNGAAWKSVELGDRSFTTAAAAPATGTWKRGDVVFNSAPLAGGSMGWMCVTAGSPGTWKAMPGLEP